MSDTIELELTPEQIEKLEPIFSEVSLHKPFAIIAQVMDSRYKSSRIDGEVRSYEAPTLKAKLIEGSIVFDIQETIDKHLKAGCTE